MYHKKNTTKKTLEVVQDYRRLKGTSMIEVLVALVILSFGALGAAAMQVTSKKANHEAQQRFIATYLANDIIEKMRINPAVLVTYAGADVGNGSIAAEPNPNCSTGNDCTSNELALHDRWLWEQAIDGVAVRVGGANTGGLVQPTGCIANNAGRIQIVISWWGSEQTSDAGTNGVAACGTASSHRRQLVVNTFI